MSYQALARYCTCALIAVLLAPSLRAQQPAAPTTVTRAYTIFLRGTPVGDRKSTRLNSSHT